MMPSHCYLELAKLSQMHLPDLRALAQAHGLETVGRTPDKIAAALVDCNYIGCREQTTVPDEVVFV